MIRTLARVVSALSVFCPAVAGAAGEPIPAASSSAAVEAAPAASPAPAPASDTPKAVPPASAPELAKPAAEQRSDLQSPAQLSTRYSAYSLPAQQWAITTGALGVGDGDLFALLSVGYGLGARVHLNINLAHAGVGLLNLGAGYHFIDTRYFDLGLKTGVWYGHGDWFWIATPVSKKLLSKIDVVKVPIELVASSMPTRWLELDLGVQYNWSKLFGAAPDDESLFTKAQLGLVQFFLRPGVRFFISDNTALEFFTKLPLYSALPLERETVTVPFKDTWWFEGGLRSRLAPGLYGNIRLNYAAISDVLYGARLYPAFEIEVRP
ncbi:MAG TPA: hypothetical protein VFK05_13835 [Polyangiaceae bacterium]|nr:hypothetical protein [Polyangiaceae bacterium]